MITSCILKELAQTQIQRDAALTFFSFFLKQKKRQKNSLTHLERRLQFILSGLCSSFHLLLREKPNGCSMVVYVSENETPPGLHSQRRSKSETVSRTKCWSGPSLCSPAWEAVLLLCCFDMKAHGSRAALSSAAKSRAFRISPVHWRLLRYLWPGQWVLGIHRIP